MFADYGDVQYIVKSGDTLDAISQRYGLDYQYVADYNGITNPDHIEIGQVINIPTDETNAPVQTTKPSPVPVAKPLPQPVIQTLAQSAPTPPIQVTADSIIIYGKSFPKFAIYIAGGLVGLTMLYLLFKPRPSGATV